MSKKNKVAQPVNQNPPKPADDNVQNPPKIIKARFALEERVNNFCNDHPIIVKTCKIVEHGLAIVGGIALVGMLKGMSQKDTDEESEAFEADDDIIDVDFDEEDDDDEE